MGSVDLDRIELIIRSIVIECITGAAVKGEDCNQHNCPIITTTTTTTTTTTKVSTKAIRWIELSLRNSMRNSHRSKFLTHLVFMKAIHLIY